MKNTIISFLIFLAASLCYGEGKEAFFEKTFRDALETSDEALFKLVEFSDNTPDLFREMILQSLQGDRIKTIESISFTVPDESAVFEFEYEGVTYIPTLKIVKEMQIVYDMSEDASGVSGTTYRLGVLGGELRIVAPMPKTMADPDAGLNSESLRSSP